VSEQNERPGQRRSGNHGGASAGRPDGSARSEGTERPARSDSAKRPERSGGAKRPARSDGGNRPERSGGNRPERSSGGNRPARSDGAKRPESAGRPERAQRSERRAEPPLPPDVTGAELDRAVRAELASLASMNADIVARHLVMAGRLLDEDPETSYLHATAAAQRAGRVGVVREAAGLAAYRSGRYAEALSELRAARRITGDSSLLAVMADCERGLGRPERAIEMAATPEVARMDVASRVELLIVVSGARRDMGQPDAAVLALQGAGLKPSQRKAWSARLFYAYADALGEAGRTDEAVTWFGHAAAADSEGETDADVRIAELSGVTFLEADDGDDDY
jgi:tetratricopeptide (TPR) repeat protein